MPPPKKLKCKLVMRDRDRLMDECSKKKNKKKNKKTYLLFIFETTLEPQQQKKYLRTYAPS